MISYRRGNQSGALLVLVVSLEGKMEEIGLFADGKGAVEIDYKGIRPEGVDKLVREATKSDEKWQVSKSVIACVKKGN